MISKNTNVKNYLICGLNRNIYTSVEQASNAHEIWRIVEVTHQGTSSMKHTCVTI